MKLTGNSILISRNEETDLLVNSLIASNAEDDQRYEALQRRQEIERNAHIDRFTAMIDAFEEAQAQRSLLAQDLMHQAGGGFGVVFAADMLNGMLTEGFDREMQLVNQALEAQIQVLEAQHKTVEKQLLEELTSQYAQRIIDLAAWAGVNLSREGAMRYACRKQSTAENHVLDELSETLAEGHDFGAVFVSGPNVRHEGPFASLDEMMQACYPDEQTQRQTARPVPNSSEVVFVAVPNSSEGGVFVAGNGPLQGSTFKSFDEMKQAMLDVHEMKGP